MTRLADKAAKCSGLLVGGDNPGYHASQLAANAINVMFASCEVRSPFGWYQIVLWPGWLSTSWKKVMGWRGYDGKRRECVLPQYPVPQILSYLLVDAERRQTSETAELKRLWTYLVCVRGGR